VSVDVFSLRNLDQWNTQQLTGVAEVSLVATGDVSKIGHVVKGFGG